MRKMNKLISMVLTICLLTSVCFNGTIAFADEETESRSLDRFRITVYTMEHGKRLGREQVDVQKRGQKAAGR